MVHYYQHKDFQEHFLECVRDASEKCIDTLHFGDRAKQREVSREEVLALQKTGLLERYERARDGTIKVCLRHQTKAGRLLEGIFLTDGRSLLGITVYELLPLRRAA